MEEKKTLKKRFEDLKEKAKWKVKDGKQWCSNHKSEIVVFGPVLITMSVDIVKILMKKSTVSEERHLKDCYIYTRENNIGHHYELKRKLKSKEWLQIHEMVKNGENLGEILQDMGVLK